MDPQIVSAGVGGLLSGFTSLLSNRSAKRENERNRQFSAEQARLARQYNTQMVNDQNHYNSPEETVKRLTAAGINPALAYANGGSIGSVGVGSTSMQATPSGGYSPAGSDVAMSGAEIAERLSASRSNEANAGLTKEQMEWYPKLSENECLIGGTVRLVNASIAGLNDQKKAESVKTVERLDQEIQNLKKAMYVYDADIRNKDASTRSLNADAFIKEIDALFEGPRMQAIIDNLRADTGYKGAMTQLSKGQLRELLSMLPYKLEIAMYEAQGKETEAKILTKKLDEITARVDQFMPEEYRGILLRNDSTALDIVLKEGEADWQKVKQWCDLLTDACSSIADLILAARGGVKLNVGRSDGTSGVLPQPGQPPIPYN